MALCLPLSSNKDMAPVISFVKTTNSFVLTPLRVVPNTIEKIHYNNKINARRNLSISISCSSIKIVRSPSLDKHVVKQNKIRFVHKLKTLLLSKPKHYMPLHILSKCRSYLSLSRPQSIRKLIYRYPTVFELFSIPTPPTPLNATKSYSQLCVRLTPAAAALAAQETNLKRDISVTLATKLQKLLMLSSHRRIVLSKLVHLAPDLGLPVNFRSRLCNDHPDKFKTVDTSYGRALELVYWDPQLANPLPTPEVESSGLIVERPLKFKKLKLRKGLNLKRPHRDFLIKFGEFPDVCPYKTLEGELAKESIEAEKRACAVVREILGMMVEKRTLVDHLTHLRKDFGLPNKLRGMLVRHPELFYVSLKGQRDSVFLVEGYDDNGGLLVKDEALVTKERLMELVREGKRIRRERRKGLVSIDEDDGNVDSDDDDDDDVDVDEDDGFANLFEYEEFDVADDDSEYGINDDESSEVLGFEAEQKFWTAEAPSDLKSDDGESIGPW